MDEKSAILEKIMEKYQALVIERKILVEDMMSNLSFRVSNLSSPKIDTQSLKRKNHRIYGGNTDKSWMTEVNYGFEMWACDILHSYCWAKEDSKPGENGASGFQWNYSCDFCDAQIDIKV